MNSVRLWLLFIIAFSLSISARANQSSFSPKVLSLESYEPNTIGETKDKDDVPFMDFKISVKYPLFPAMLHEQIGPDTNLYFAFTGRFGQYISTRSSSPVIGKRFNPKLIWRQTLSWNEETYKCVSNPATSVIDSSQCKSDRTPLDYIDFAYAHESNGQSITTLNQYLQARADADKPDFANDHLSRGWDYLEVTGKHVWPGQNSKLSGYLSGKYYLKHGLLQGDPEEYNDWENNPEGKPRKSVNGLSGILKWQWKREIFKDYIYDPKLAIVFETGYSQPFKYNTTRMELGFKVIELPITFWRQTGYGSDLAQYYKKVNSVGIELEIGSF